MNREENHKSCRFGRSLSVGMIFLLVLVFALTGCRKKEDDGHVSDPDQQGTEDNQTPGADGTEDGQTGDDAQDGNSQTGDDKKDDPEKELGSTKDVPIYSIDTEKLEVKAAVKVVPETDELTAEYVVALVVEELKAESVDVGILDVKQEGDSVTVNFDKTKAPVANVGAGLEASILDCISHSLLDNVKGCKKVYLRVDGGMYETGHMRYELDEPYE
ncbi:GerMN domain-containing protein [Anaerolentibacter hominis]|uniref:GerMN domain-containing protein n=1 Tax=Anaerolentibacter hominis TaxID=3079009 RepID=UPI0031B7FC29